MNIFDNVLFIGTNGFVAAIDRQTGQELWRQSLDNRGAIMSITLAGTELYAAGKGYLYRLDPYTGQVLWKNGLTGMGYGAVTMAVPGASAVGDATLAAAVAHQQAAQRNASMH